MLLFDLDGLGRFSRLGVGGEAIGPLPVDWRSFDAIDVIGSEWAADSFSSEVFEAGRFLRLFTEEKFFVEVSFGSTSLVVAVDMRWIGVGGFDGDGLPGELLELLVFVVLTVAAPLEAVRFYLTSPFVVGTGEVVRLGEVVLRRIEPHS